ncbi:MAG TPA: hypothetical protein DCQ56_00865 [Porphyromonadaceae bacterium]|nr:hypothetical protein [Porphyromonadaceae bacterium]
MPTITISDLGINTSQEFTGFQSEFGTHPFSIVVGIIGDVNIYQVPCAQSITHDVRIYLSVIQKIMIQVGFFFNGQGVAQIGDGVNKFADRQLYCSCTRSGTEPAGQQSHQPRCSFIVM